MPAPQNLRSSGERIEQLLDELHSVADERSCDLAEELLRLVSVLYGAGLARVMELAREQAPDLSGTFVKDDLIASLLLVHGLHPDTLEHRVEEALAKVRPLLGAHAGDVELLDIDAGAGAVRLRLLGSCDGCPSSAVTLQMAVERAIVEAAPEIVRIDVDQPSTEPARAAPVPVSMGTKPEPQPVPGRVRAVYTECPAEMAGA
jgi:Fe-S cluster biogenesis protein NfuA